MENRINYYLAGLFLLTFSFANAQKNNSDKTEKEPITTAFIKVLSRDGLNAAITNYRLLKQQQPDMYDFSEEHLQNLAFEMIEDKDLRAAKKVFELNEESFPNSSKAHYFMGFINFKLGNNDGALKAFEKAYELDSENNSARDMIVRIKKPDEYNTYQYVCGPCYCSQHECKLKDPGKCIQCGMDLVIAESK